MTGQAADISAVIFDMDGLMFDTESIVVEAWKHAGRAYGYEISASLVIQSVGVNSHDTQVLFEQALGPAFNFHRVRTLRDQYVDDMIEHDGVPLKDGLGELLDVLANHAVLKAVATSTERTRAEILLRKAGVSPRFEAVVCGNEVQRGKPAPDIFLLAADRLQATPRNCIVLEDSESGIQAAVNANMRPFMIPDLKPPSPAILAMVEQIFPNLHAVASYLSDIFTASVNGKRES